MVTPEPPSLDDDPISTRARADRSPDAVGDDPATALAVDIAETARLLFSAGGVRETLAQVVVVAVSTIEGCDHAGIFLVVGTLVTTPVLTDPTVHELDELQRSLGEGPCLDAIAQGLPVYAEDLAADDRWARFGPEAAARGVRSLLALPLTAEGPIGALNLYGRYPQAFDVADRARGLILAALAAAAHTAAQVHEGEEQRAANLHDALASREVIGQAQGILMERERITADQAFDILRRASQHLNIKLRSVAQTLVETGERPETGTGHPD
jgi:GAF domain-containing protein